MKEPITKFNFEDAFKALDDIPVPTAEKGIRANRQDLHETMRKVDKFELLFEDFYDVNDSEDMNAASEEREAEVAKAKLARIEKIVDLDAETEDDILPSYVGKIIIQCPQCMTLFYKSPEDIEKDEENPDVVNVNEACQHCGNTSGYDIIGKVAEEDAQEEAMDDFGSDLEGEDTEGNGENDVSVEDTTEEETSDEGEVDELSAEVDLEEIDLDEIPGEEEVEESLHNSEALKDAEEESDLKTENESKKLTLNEDIDEDLDAKLKAHDEYITHLRTTIEQEEKALEAEKNEQIKTSIQGRIDTLKAELEAALPDAVKVDAPAEDIEVTEEETIETEETVEETTEEASVEEVEETTEETPAEENEPEEEVKEALNEGLTENAIPGVSESEVNALFDSEEFKKPVSKDEVESFFESVEDSTAEPEEEEATSTEPAAEEKPDQVEVLTDGDEKVTEAEVKKLTEVTDIDEESFNKKITESLCAVYENVESFTMTDCTLNESTLVVEGDIAFKSGKTKNTSYIFEAVENTDSIKLTGSNTDLFENGQIGMTCNIINESLQATTLDYKYTIGKNLVEGLIK